jgi:hypothetical protein
VPSSTFLEREAVSSLPHSTIREHEDAVFCVSPSYVLDDMEAVPDYHPRILEKREPVS